MATVESPMGRDDDNVRVRWLDLAEAGRDDERRWLALLDAEERARAARFYHESDRFAFIAAHALLRVMLSDAFGGRPQSWRFIAKAHGKPALDPAFAQSALQFNLSHSRSAVACAVARAHPVGVDIEETSRDSDLMSLARSYFAPAEVVLLEAAAEDERAVVFFQLWTLKEAYAKARGEGLSLAFDRFAFSLDPIRIDLSGAAPAEASAWRFRSLSLPRGLRLSVATRSERAIDFDIRAISPTQIEDAHAG